MFFRPEPISNNKRLTMKAVPTIYWMLAKVMNKRKRWQHKEISSINPAGLFTLKSLWY